MKRFLMLFICLCLSMGLFTISAAGSPRSGPLMFPSRLDGAGIVMDSDTGRFFTERIWTSPVPASITKIPTALIVLEQCDLNEMWCHFPMTMYTMWRPGSSSAGIDEGDVLTVRDCLPALMLASANESANALACHVSGSREELPKLMNEKAISLGCRRKPFCQPQRPE